jgi:pimeloyl-ACP methyl ester carboxylesterase
LGRSPTIAVATRRDAAHDGLKRFVNSMILTVAERRIEYRLLPGRSAAATDLVMLHEGLGSVSTWGDLPDRVCKVTGCRTLAYSRLGYGRSSALTDPRGADYMHEEARTWLPAVLNALQVRRPVLFGHSDGASIALIHASDPTHQVRGVIALAPHVMVEGITISGIERARAQFLDSDLRARLAPYHADVDGAFWGWNRAWLDPAFREWNIEPMLRSITAPVLVIQGTDDEYGTVAQVDRIRRALPNSEYLEIPQCGHSPQRTHRSLVVNATARFVGRLAGIDLPES